MGWQDSHLHQFIIGNERYGVPDLGWEDDDTIDEQVIKLSSVLQGKTKLILYAYDFGDGWEHEIVLEKVLPLEPKETIPKCIHGERSCPPEDCGGIYGYQELLDIIADPDHEEHQNMIDWIGGKFSPEYFNIDEVNELLKDKETEFT